MQIIDISPRHKGLAAVTLSPPPEQGLSGAEYEGERLLLDCEILARCAIQKGVLLSGEELRQLVYVSESYRAKQRAVWYLSQSNYSEKALFEKLCRTFTDRAAAFAVGQMVEKGYLNDRAYAERLTAQLKEKNHSKRAIQNKLFLKGVPAGLVNEVLAEAELTDSEADRVLALLQTKYQHKLQDEEGIRKTVLALQRRGFSYSHIKAALQKQMEGEEIF